MDGLVPATVGRCGLPCMVALVCAGLFSACAAPPGPVAIDPAQVIRTALSEWAADFNSGRRDKVCGLFARDLRYVYGSSPERGYRQICDQLQRALADGEQTFAYAADIEEILVSGDLAVVRLDWALTVTDKADGAATTSREAGLDVFRRQADGSWKISRFIAFDKDG